MTNGALRTNFPVASMSSSTILSPIPHRPGLVSNGSPANEMIRGRTGGDVRVPEECVRAEGAERLDDLGATMEPVHSPVSIYSESDGAGWGESSLLQHTRRGLEGDKTRQAMEDGRRTRKKDGSPPSQVITVVSH